MLGGLSIPALRHYDEVGLLKPARVDPDTAYRYYRLDQVREARVVRALRRSTPDRSDQRCLGWR